MRGEGMGQRTGPYGDPRRGYDSRRTAPYGKPSWNSRNEPQERPKDRAWGEPSRYEEVRHEKEEAPRKQAQTTNVERNMQTSGVLAEETNMKNGVLLKHTLPLDARKPVLKWWLFVFSNKSNMDNKTLTLGDSSCYLFGSDARVADVPIMHPTTSKQHAVICFRWNSKRGETCPYLMDLNSTNGTFLNHDQIEPTRYYELLPGDIIKFAKSSRDYVIMNDEREDEPSSLDDEQDDLSEANAGGIKSEGTGSPKEATLDLPYEAKQKTGQEDTQPSEDKILADLIQVELAKERAKRKTKRGGHI
ncbi:FHA domain protein [Gregarina niphandrodes]|uniref:FHA domain protein n=1 Tax=Gregarina niphandrodes TaxID=110365 RepID=A0A023B2P6_GRENI|nr:FHA domain protein [Gregarina niphandrodes]EZG55069.1 FHA domain protein [Gregarina niphandrodes]|eukprot:XP_011131795.1 FHA domain protein [Gregarina niphandrodes]